MYRPLLRAYRIKPLLKSSAPLLISPRVGMSLRRPHSTKESANNKSPSANGNGNGSSPHSHQNGHKEHGPEHDNEHTHSHSIFGHSHSHDDAHTHDAEQIIAALKGTGEPRSSPCIQNIRSRDAKVTGGAKSRSLGWPQMLSLLVQKAQLDGICIQHHCSPTLVIL